MRIDEPGKVAALDAGTDDWMAKPFGEEEERLTGGSPPDFVPAAAGILHFSQLWR